ncbi:MAG: hypothetical protein ABI654_05780 [Betaproteobacteria bacterium]
MLRRLIRWICCKYAVRNKARGELHAAIKMWSIAVACGDDSPQTGRNLGESYFRLGDYAGAVPLLEAAARHFAGDGPLAEMLAQAREQVAPPASMPPQPEPGTPDPSFAQSLRDAFNASQAGGAADPERPPKLMLRTGGDSFDALDLMNVLGARVGHTDEAIGHIAGALWRNPGSAEAHTLLGACAWSRLTPVIESLRQRVTQEKSGEVSPLGLLPLAESSASEQHQCARQYAQQQYGDYLSRPPLCGTRRREDRNTLRIGYLSADYHDHPTSFLVAQIIERHDRERFEVFGYSCGPDSEVSMRKRMRAAFDTFRDVRPLSHEAAAQQILDDGIDILVELNGYTTNARLEIPALRPAPVQVSWLGYPGTLGHPRLADYLIGDPIVTPLADAAFYSEKLALMPGCIQPNERQFAIGAAPHRTAAGLPAQGFVFCCFNQSYKITPAIFDLWCRLLTEVPGSVLWLLGESDAARRNLQQEALRRGVAPDRLIFAPRVTYAEHLARFQLADLFLDTLPFNGGATGSDALRAGVPLVTCPGETFIARLATSLLHAAGLPELVTHSLLEYEALALRLATDGTLHSATRTKLARNRDTCALFDSERFTRDLERLFRRMWTNHRAGSLEPIDLGARDG